jgi:dienelactone hydrolase
MKILSIFTLLITSLLTLSSASAEIRSEAISYQDNGANLTGHLFWDDSIQRKRPGVLVVHEWWGLGDYAKWRAAQLAQMSYIAFAADMYGGDKLTTHPAQVREWMNATPANLDDWRKRALKGLEQRSSSPLTDTSRMTAIGYCYGGATIMQLA